MTFEEKIIWHEVKTRPLTDEEKKYYEENFDYVPDYAFDCEMPDNDQEILIYTKWGVSIDTNLYDDGGFYLDCRGDWDDVLAWAELPKYKDGEKK